jgi:uncharacterized protein (DUF697 family)
MMTSNVHPVFHGAINALATDGITTALTNVRHELLAAKLDVSIGNYRCAAQQCSTAAQEIQRIAELLKGMGTL